MHRNRSSMQENAKIQNELPMNKASEILPINSAESYHSVDPF